MTVRLVVDSVRFYNKSRKNLLNTLLRISSYPFDVEVPLELRAASSLLIKLTAPGF